MKNVAQVVIDGALAYIRASLLLEREYPHIF